MSSSRGDIGRLALAPLLVSSDSSLSLARAALAAMRRAAPDAKRAQVPREAVADAQPRPARLGLGARWRADLMLCLDDLTPDGSLKASGIWMHLLTGNCLMRHLCDWVFVRSFWELERLQGWLANFDVFV
jgi:hypothetical protein